MKALKVRAIAMGIYGIKRHYPAEADHKRAGEPFLLIPRKGWRKDKFGKKHSITLTAEQQFSPIWMEKLGVVELDRHEAAAHQDSRVAPQEQMLREEIADLKAKLTMKRAESARLKKNASDAQIPPVPEEEEIPEDVPAEKETTPTGDKEII